MGGGPGGPQWVERMLARLERPGRLRELTSELEELYAHRRKRDGEASARRWFRRELRRYLWRTFVQRAGRLVGLGGASRGPAERMGSALRSASQNLRGLARAPVFTSSIVLTIGLGIGGCVAIFAVVDALLLRPLPYPDADRLEWVFTDSPPNEWPLSVVDFQALEAQQTSFEAVAAYAVGSQTFADGDVVDPIPVRFVTPGYFGVLGITPAGGRFFRTEDGLPDAEATVIVTHGFAERRLGGGEEAVGAVIRLDGVATTVVGVLPPEFGPLGKSAQAFPALRLSPPTRKGPFFLRVVGRRLPEVEPAVALQELRAINQRLFPLWADSYQDERTSWGVKSLADALSGGVSGMLMALLGAVGFVLLIATANAANLMLARVGARRPELAVRAALGASSGQIVGHLLIESLLLALGGVAVGMVVAKTAIGVLPLVASSYMPRLDEVSMGGPVLVFAALAALASGMLFGLMPALHGGKSKVAADLRTGGRSGSNGTRQQRYQRLLVIAELAIAVPLLTGGGLLASSFANLSAVDPGFDPDNLITMRVSLSAGSYAGGASRTAFWDRATERIGALPGVMAVSVASTVPPRHGGSNNFDLEDDPTPPGASQPAVPWILTAPGFFEMVGVRMIEGRGPDTRDNRTHAVVDEVWARRFFPGESALGKRFKSGGCTACDWTEIVGVVQSIQWTDPSASQQGVVYQFSEGLSSAPFLYVRTAGDPTAVVPLIRDEIRQLDRSVPISAVKTAGSLLDDSLARPRHLAIILGGFSLLALVLAVIGLYGITAYAVQRRRSDIAIRIALGGTPRSVLTAVLKQGMTLAVVGLVLGVVFALGVTRVLSGLLYGVAPTDGRTLVAVSVLMAIVALVASWLPARSAAGVDPATILREE